MIWLTWRQSRLESLIGGVALALVAAWLVWTGLEMTSAYDDQGLAACLTAQTPDQACRIAVGHRCGRRATAQTTEIKSRSLRARLFRQAEHHLADDVALDL